MGHINIDVADFRTHPGIKIFIFITGRNNIAQQVIGIAEGNDMRLVGKAFSVTVAFVSSKLNLESIQPFSKKLLLNIYTDTLQGAGQTL